MLVDEEIRNQIEGFSKGQFAYELKKAQKKGFNSIEEFYLNAR